MNVTLEQASTLIKEGGIVAFPTETVYGLGADAFNIQAVKKTFETKGRPPDNPLIVHISILSQLDELAVNIPADVHKLAKQFWPGPLTIVLKKSNNVPDIVTGGLPTVAVRMPDHPLALELIKNTGPLTAPSANRSGKPSPTRISHIVHDYGKSLPYIDGGTCRVGLESTVLDLTGQPEILRPGAISGNMIEKIISKKVIVSTNNSTIPPKSPGTKYTHYKPVATVHSIENIPDIISGENYYILHSTCDLTPKDNLHLYQGDYSALARDLYDHFRNADFLGYSNIYIEEIPDNHPNPITQVLKNRIHKSIG